MRRILFFISLGTFLSKGQGVIRECYVSKDGVNTYQGNKSTTITGRTCQRWDVTVPHTHTHVDDPEAVENYCRVLNDVKPWCYTLDKSVRWEYCGIPECEKESPDTAMEDLPSVPSTGDSENIDCYEKGHAYLGNISTTFTGLTCQDWSAQIPHEHDHANDINAEMNFCRIIQDERPWCYTTDTNIRWEYCMVPDCESVRLLQELTSEFARKIPVTSKSISTKEALSEQTAESDKPEATAPEQGLSDHSDTTTLSNDFSMRNSSTIQDKITTSGPGALFVKDTEVKVKPAAARSLVKSISITMADPVQTADTDLNPDVSIQRELYTSDVNQKISIQCFVSPNQDLYIHWYKDGVFLEDIGLDIRTGSILILKDVQEEDSGVYTCEAGNSRATTTVLIGKARQDKARYMVEKDTTTIGYRTSFSSGVTTSTETPNPEITDNIPNTTSTPAPVSRYVDTTPNSINPVEDFVTPLITAPQIVQTTTQQPATTTTSAIIQTTSLYAINNTDSPQPDRLQEKLYTTTIKSVISTRSNNQQKLIIDFTTSQPKKSTTHGNDRLLPSPSGELSYNIQTERGQSATDQKLQREETKRPLVVLLKTDDHVSSNVNYNVQDRKPEPFRVTVPVRTLTTSPKVRTLQLARAISQRYENVNPPDTKFSLQLEENRRKSDGYQHRSGDCRTKCDGERSCYVDYNCTHYQHCFEQDSLHCACALMTCAVGTFWNSAIHNCDAVSNVNCDKDLCKRKSRGSTYSSGFNCRSYYQCNEMGRSMAMCCTNKHSYNPDKGKCVYDESCDIDCTSRTPTERQKDLRVNLQVTETYDLCYLRPVKDRPTKYFNAVFKVEQDCPPGTVFMADICVCGLSLKISRNIPVTLYSNVCDGNIAVDFSGRKVTNDAQRPAHLQSTDVRIISSGKAGLNYGLFNGRTSQIFSERFFAVTFRRLLIRMRFYSDGSGGPEHQILISNCDSMAKPWNIPELRPSQKPSLAIILSRTTGTLTFLGYSAYSTPAIIRLPYSKTSWNNVELIFNGRTFEARVGTVGKGGTLSEFKDSKPLSGRIAVSIQPLRVGKCSKHDAFYGYFDIIKMYNNCIPSDS